MWLRRTNIVYYVSYQSDLLMVRWEKDGFQNLNKSKVFHQLSYVTVIII